MPPRDSWSQLYSYINEQAETAIKSCVSGSMTSFEEYKAVCRKISTLNDIAEKMKELVGNPNAPGEDV